MNQEFDLLRLVYLLGFFILVWPAAWAMRRSKSEALRNMAIWIVIAAALAAAYLAFGP